MERRNTKGTKQPQTGGLGVVVLAIGIGLILADDFTVASIGRVLALGGLVFACYQKLDRRISERNLAADEIYQVGYEAGEARGYEEGLAAASVRPVVIDLAEQRDLRFDAIKNRPLTSAVSAGDRD